MGYKAEIIADSISPFDAGARLTTFEITIPRIILAELNTHRDKSRNSASSRAIPVEKMLERVMTDPFVPVYWGKKQGGMQADAALTPAEQEQALGAWLNGRDAAVQTAKDLLACGLHKQIVNRVLEPWLWHTVVITGTEWENFFNQRRDIDAQPEMRKIAELMFELYEASAPMHLAAGAWHLPYITAADHEYDAGWHILAEVSCARCARVSYLRQGEVRDFEADLAMTAKLIANGHMSPLEHAATPAKDSREGARLDPYTGEIWYGNLRGWQSYRKTIPGEAVFRQGRGPRLVRE